MDNVHFNMNLGQRKHTKGTWMLTASVSCSIASLCLNPWESHMHNIFLILSIATSLFRLFHCNCLPKALRNIQHIIGVLLAIPPVILDHNQDQNLTYFNFDFKNQVILLLDLTSILLKVVNIIFNIRASSHSSKNNTLRKLQEQAQTIIDAQTKIIRDLSMSSNLTKSMLQSSNPNNKTDLKSTRLNNLDPNKRQLSLQVIKRNTVKQKKSSEEQIKVIQEKQIIKIGFQNKKNNRKIIQNCQDEQMEKKIQGDHLQEQESEKVVHKYNNDMLVDQKKQEKKMINPKKEMIQQQNGIYFDKSCLKQQQFKSPGPIDERIIEDFRLRKQVASNFYTYHLNEDSPKQMLLTQKKNPYSSSTSKQNQQEQYYPLESLINRQELPNTHHPLLLEPRWCIKTHQNLSAELPNCDENHNNQSKPDFSEQSSVIASKSQEQLKMEQMNSVVKNKWRMKQRFLCDKIKNISTPFFQSTENLNSGAVSEPENQSDFSQKEQDGQVQVAHNKQKQLTFDLTSSLNSSMMTFVKPLESDTKKSPKVIASTISEDSFLNIHPPTADSPVEIKEISNDPINTNQIQILSTFQTKPDKPGEISKLPDLKNISNEQDETQVLRKIKNETEQQQNTLSCTRQKSPLERPSNVNQKPTVSAGGDEYEISTNDESNFTSINSACSQTFQPDSHSKKCQSLKKIPQKPQSQQLKRSISGNSIRESKSTMQLSFSADDISTKDNQAQQSNKVQQKQKQQSISIPAQVVDDKRSSSQKCFEQFMYLKQGKTANIQEVISVRNQLNIQEENGIGSQSQAPAELITQQQGKLNTKDCSVRQIPQNKVKQIAVRMKFEQDLQDEIDDSEEKGYDCSDNEDSLGDSSNSEDGDEDCIEDDSSEDDQSFSVSSRSTLRKEKVTFLNTDLYSDFHSPTLSFAQQQLNSSQNFSLQQKEKFAVPEQAGQFSKQTSQNAKYQKKKATKSQLFNEQHQACFLNASPCEGDEDEADLKKKKKKQKSQEQKKNRRNKRKEKLKNKKKDSNKLVHTCSDHDNNHIDQTHKQINEDSHHSNLQLKRLLDENLLEYFTINLSLSAHINLSIYITDFYQFDEQFDLQSLSYGIDGSTILDAKINFIFQISTLQLYPAMADFFDSLLNSYAKIKQSHLLEKYTDFSNDIELLTQAFIESFNVLFQNEISNQDTNNQSEIQLQLDIFSAFTSELSQEQEQQQLQKNETNLLITEVGSSLNPQKEDYELVVSNQYPLQFSS